MDRATELSILTDIARAAVAKTRSDEPTCTRLSVDRYRSDERARREMEAVFARTWLLIGRSSRVAEPGAFFTTEVSGAPWLIVRQPDGALRGFFNVCRHRGAALQKATCGVAKRLVCPFHGWNYELDGALRHIPDEHDFPGIDRGAHGLRPIAVGEFGGFVFACGDVNAPPLHDFLGGVIPSLSGDGLPEAIEVHRVSREYAANWKLGVELFTEAYHTRTLHARTVNPILEQSGVHVTRFGPHTRSVIPRRKVLKVARELAQTRAIDPTSIAEAAPKMMPGGGADLATKGLFSLRFLSNTSYGIFPNTIVLMLPTSFVLMQCWPLGARRCRYDYAIFCPPGASYADELFHAERIKNWDDVSAEDTGNLEALQRGVESGAIDHVTFGDQERLIPELHQHLERAIEQHSAPAPRSLSVVSG